MKFEIGDKIALYTNGLRVVGIVYYVYGDKVEIEDVVGGRWRGHYKQCRKIVKVKTIRVPQKNGLKNARLKLSACKS